MAMPFTGAIRVSFFPDTPGDTVRAELTMRNDASFGQTHAALSRLEARAYQADRELRGQTTGAVGIANLQVLSEVDQSGKITIELGDAPLSAQYFIRGMDNIIGSNMEQMARNYFASLNNPQREQHQRINGYQVARQWQELPQGIRRVFRQPPAKLRELFKRTDGDWLQPPKNIYFLIRYEHQGETVFIAHSMSPSTVSKLVDRNATQSRNTLFLVSGLSALILTVAIWLRLRRVSQPVAALGWWTRAFDSEKLNQPPPDFAYAELNELAELIRTLLRK